MAIKKKGIKRSQESNKESHAWKEKQVKKRIN